MTTNTTPSVADTLLQLIENYVEKRHTHGAPEYNVVTARARDAVRAALAAQAHEAALRDSLHDCALGDSNYAAGMLLGWNLCTDGRDEDFRRIREDRLRAAASASKEAHEAAQAVPQGWPPGPTLKDLTREMAAGDIAMGAAAPQPAQQPLTDEHKAILKECRNQAMRWTLKARIPESGAFGGIAQDLDYLCGQLGIKND